MWNDPQKAQEVMREREDLDNRINRSSSLERDCDTDMIELGEAEGDGAIGEGRLELLKAALKEARARQLETLFSGEADANDTYLRSMPAPAAPKARTGRECCCACMCAGPSGAVPGRSARRDAGRRGGHQVGHHPHQGPQCLWLAEDANRGVHRLVRISPFNSNARRHTSFASVWVYPGRRRPDRDRDQRERLQDRHLPRLRRRRPARQHDRFGGSHHAYPTGIVVACQNERSQHKNRATAWNMLRARLYELELEKREAGEHDAATKTDIGWGHQIRSYVLQPYQMVKDLRTGHTPARPSDVLDGDLDDFMQASLAQRIHGGGPEAIEDIE